MPKGRWTLFQGSYCGVIVVGWLLAAGSAAAQAPPPPEEEGVHEEMVAEEIVVTGTKTKSRRDKLSLPVDVVSDNDVKETGSSEVGELIENLPGVSTFRPAGPRFATPVIRGMTGRRVILLVDGMRVDSGKNMGATAFFLDPFSLRRVEVLRGPGSVMWGSDAMGGVVNYIPVGPMDQDGFNSRLGFVYGSNNGETVERGALAFANDRFGVRVSGIRRDASNFSGASEEIRSSQYHDTTANIDVAMRWRRGSTTTAGFLFYLADDVGKAASELDIEKHRTIRFPNELHYRATLKHEEKLSQSGFFRSLEIRAMADWTDRTQHVDVYDDAWNNQISRKRKKGDFFLSGGSVLLTTRPGDRHRLTFGIDEYFNRMDSEEENTVYVAGSPMGLGSIDGFSGAMRNNMGVFVQDEWSWTQRFSVLAGARYDWVHFIPGDTGVTEDDTPQGAGDNHAFSGNVGAVYKLTKGLSLTGNVAHAFRAPTLREKYLDFNSCYGYYCGNAALRPERSVNLDVGLRGRFRPVRFELNGFYIHALDLISLGATEREECDLEHGNIGAADLAGAEAMVSFRIRPRGRWPTFKPFATGSYVRGRDSETGDPLRQIPPLNAIGGLRVDGRISLVHWYAEVTGHLFMAQDLVAEDEQTTDAYATMGARAGVVFEDLWGAGDFALRVNASNLTNEEFRNHLSPIHGMGRNFRIGADWSF